MPERENSQLLSLGRSPSTIERPDKSDLRPGRTFRREAPCSTLLGKRRKQLVGRFEFALLDLGDGYEKFVLLRFGEQKPLRSAPGEDGDDSTFGKTRPFDGNRSVYCGSSGNWHAPDGTARRDYAFDPAPITADLRLQMEEESRSGRRQCDPDRDQQPDRLIGDGGSHRATTDTGQRDNQGNRQSYRNLGHSRSTFCLLMTAFDFKNRINSVSTRVRILSSPILT